jgi:methylmalonyl-CoA/ethylmalonyl-CoA epimerase
VTAGEDQVALSELGQVFMRVQELPRAIAYYRDVLKVPFLFEAPPAMAFFQCGSVSLMLGVAERPEFDHPGSILYFNVGDIERAHGVLRQRGVEFLNSPHLIHRAGDRELWMAFFHDSEANTLALMSWRPAGHGSGADQAAG